MMLLGLGIASKIVGAFGGRKCSEDFADCDADGFGRARRGLRHVIVCYGGAGLFDKHLASTIHCIDDEIIGSLQRREQRRRARAVMSHGNPGGD
jgi:hypothetical protein